MNMANGPAHARRRWALDCLHLRCRSQWPGQGRCPWRCIDIAIGSLLHPWPIASIRRPTNSLFGSGPTMVATSAGFQTGMTGPVTEARPWRGRRLRRAIDDGRAPRSRTRSHAQVPELWLRRTRQATPADRLHRGRPSSGRRRKRHRDRRGRVQHPEFPCLAKCQGPDPAAPGEADLKGPGNEPGPDRRRIQRCRRSVEPIRRPTTTDRVLLQPHLARERTYRRTPSRLEPSVPHRREAEIALAA